MARQLKLAEVTTIRTRHASGHSNREIARLLGVNRETVGRYVAADDSKPAKPDHRALPAPRPPEKTQAFVEMATSNPWARNPFGIKSSGM